MNREQIAELKKKFPQGCRIDLVEMKDPYAPVPSGTMGTLDFIDDAGNFHVKWDNGRTLSLIWDEDIFRILLPESSAHRESSGQDSAQSMTMEGM